MMLKCTNVKKVELPPGLHYFKKIRIYDVSIPQPYDYLILKFKVANHHFDYKVTSKIYASLSKRTGHTVFD